MENKVIILIASAIALLPLFGVGLGLGKLFSSYIDSVGRNPGAKKDLLPAAMLGAALTEAIALLAFLISLLIFLKF